MKVATFGFGATIAIALTLAACTTARRPMPAPSDELVLTHARIVDPERREIRRGSLRLSELDGGRIVEELPEGATEAELGPGPRIDLGARFVLPGFKDLHMHCWGNPPPIDVDDGAPADDDIGHARCAQRVLQAGVTAFLDLGSDADVIFPLRDRQRAGLALADGARIFAAGPVLGYFRAMRTPTQARARIAALAARHADVIKIILDSASMRTRMPQPVLRAAVTEAHRHGLKVVVHIGMWADAARAIDVGADVITHLNDDQPLPPALARRMRDRGTLEIPTMAVQMDTALARSDPRLLADPLLARLTPAALRDAYRAPLASWSDKGRYWDEWQRECHDRDLASLGALLKAGVTVLPGSDSGNLGVFVGFSLHRELEHFVEAGMSTWQALYAGTIAPARLLAGERYGLKPGDAADLVVLERSPVDDIRNTRAIARVFKGGREIPLRATVSGP